MIEFIGRRNIDRIKFLDLLVEKYDGDWLTEHGRVRWKVLYKLVLDDMTVQFSYVSAQLLNRPRHGCCAFFDVRIRSVNPDRKGYSLIYFAKEWKVKKFTWMLHDLKTFTSELGAEGKLFDIRARSLLSRLSDLGFFNVKR